MFLTLTPKVKKGAGTFTELLIHLQFNIYNKLFENLQNCSKPKPTRLKLKVRKLQLYSQNTVTVFNRAAVYWF